MSTTQGEVKFPYQVALNRTIVERLDGTLEGIVEFTAEVGNSALLPQLEQTHPDDSRLEMHQREITVTGHKLVRMTGHFFGLRDDPTEPLISYVGTPDRERIETHPDFTTVLAGTPAAPLNGAEFLSIAGGVRKTFEAFTDPDDTLYGVQYYLKASTQVELTWWQTAVPTVQRMIIVDNIRPFKKPESVKNFLIVDTPYRQIGNHYQVTKILLGSDKSGWSTEVYPQ